MKRTTLFRRLVHGAEILQLPCCHDGLSARVLEQAGFKAIAAAGYGLSGSLLGMPDIGVLTGAEMIPRYRNLCDVGKPTRVRGHRYRLRRCEQRHPRSQRLRNRARHYALAGADIVFVEAVRTFEDMKRIHALLREFKTPSLANMIEGGKTPLLSANELQALGYRVVAYPCGSVFTAVKALQGWARYLKEHGTTERYRDRMLTFDKHFAFIGAHEIRDREKQFV